MGEKPRTIAYSFVEPRTVVLVHNRESPSDAEWREYVDDLVGRVAERRDGLRSLVVTDGGGPNTVQRTDLNEMVLKTSGRFDTAVVTESRVARGIVTAMSWFNSGIKAFAPKQVGDALKYLALDAQESGEVLATVDRLRAELGLGPLPGGAALA